MAGLDLLISLLHFGRLERRSATEHCVKNDSDCPVVNFVAVTVWALEDLRG